MSDLPAGWTEAPLETVVEILDSRRSPINAQERERRIAGKKQEKLYPYYGATGQVGYIDDYIFDEPLILLGEDGVPFLDLMKPKAYLVDGKYWVNNHAHALKAIEGLSDRRYLCAFLNAYDYREKVTGTTRLKLTQEAMRSIQVALAPLSEQKRIAEKLDSLLARVDSCQTHLERVPQILKRFRQSVLVAAMESTLSEEWRLANNLDENSWQDTTLDEICVEDRVITYGVIKLGDDIPNGIPCLRTSNVRWLSIDEDGMKRIKPELSESYSRTILQGNEVLVNVRGTLGGVSVVKPHMIGWNVSREVAIAPLNTELALPEFIAIWIASNSSQNWLTRRQKGVAYTGINIEDLRQLPVKLPSIEEQAEIVRRVEKLFAYAERLEARYASVSERVGRLSPSLLGKAFRGELVGQEAG